MAKEKKKTLRELYSEVLSRSGIELKDVELLSYKFERRGKAHCFHFDLMRSRIHFCLFDSYEDGRVIVGMPKTASEDIDKVALMAVEGGGVRSPLFLDYERN